MSTETTTPSTIQVHQIDFKGDGLEYFKIMIVNWLLTVVTLGLYYPWARAKKLKYLYSHTEINDESFHFSGTGKEMFIGFVKIMAIYLVLSGIMYTSIYYNQPLIFLFAYLIILAFIPFAIHGSFKYRMSRTSYKGIRFGYRGLKKDVSIMFYKDIFFTIITFGIYGSWMLMNLRRYTHSNIRYGDVEFSNNSRGSDFFKIMIVGYILTGVSLGIYYFWWKTDIYNYYVNSISIKKGDNEIFCYSNLMGFEMLKLMVGNFFIIVFTLGLGTAWAEMRSKKYLTNSICLKGNINLDSIHQTEEEYTNALGEDAMDFFDLDII